MLAFKSLLELVKQIAVKPTPDNKAKLPAYSKEVAAAVGEVVHAAEKMKSEFGWAWSTFGTLFGYTVHVLIVPCYLEVVCVVCDCVTGVPAHTGDWVDQSDPNVIAETELLQAAASIEAAAKKLADLQPRERVVSETSACSSSA